MSGARAHRRQGASCCSPAGSSPRCRRSSPSLLWRRYGGSVYAPELVDGGRGHVLNAGLTIALAAAAAAVAEHPSTAAILTLSVTVGTWIVNFIAAVAGRNLGARGGLHADGDGRGVPARPGPARPAARRVLADCGGLRAVRRIWLRLGIAGPAPGIGVGRPSRRSPPRRSSPVPFVTPSWDYVREPDELVLARRTNEALAQIREPLRIEAHLAPEDPRRVDLERRALSKLRRVMPAAPSALRVGDVDRPVRADRRSTTARSGTSSAVDAR